MNRGSHILQPSTMCLAIEKVASAEPPKGSFCTARGRGRTTAPRRSFRARSTTFVQGRPDSAGMPRWAMMSSPSIWTLACGPGTLARRVSIMWGVNSLSRSRVGPSATRRYGPSLGCGATAGAPAGRIYRCTSRLMLRWNTAGRLAKWMESLTCFPMVVRKPTNYGRGSSLRSSDKAASRPAPLATVAGLRC